MSSTGDRQCPEPVATLCFFKPLKNQLTLDDHLIIFHPENEHMWGNDAFPCPRKRADISLEVVGFLWVVVREPGRWGGPCSKGKKYTRFYKFSVRESAFIHCIAYVLFH